MRDIGLFAFWPVFDWFWYQGNTGFIKSITVFLPLLISGRDCIELVLILL